MKKTARIGKSSYVFVTAGLVAGSALPVYAAMVGSMAVEENTIVQSESEQMPQGDVIALDDIGISVRFLIILRFARMMDLFIFTRWQMSLFLM